MKLFYDPKMLSHDMGAGHPERPDRLRSIAKALWRDGPAGEPGAPPEVELDAVRAVHDAEYVDEILEVRGEKVRFDADTSTSPGTVDAALSSAGGAVAAVDAVLDGQTDCAWNMGRPPGHHAERDRAMGFCFFNNVAIAAQHALSRGLERVLVVDWDVHHGNGTQHIFEDRSDVLFFSTHQWPLFPGTGALEEQGRGDGAGYTVNVPLPSGADDGVIATAFENILVPIAAQYEPELVLMSAGFDAHRFDPLATLEVTTAGFANLARIVRNIAEDHCDGRVVLTLEGGYHLEALAASVKRVWQVMEGGDAEAVELTPTRAVHQAWERHATHWALD